MEKLREKIHLRIVAGDANKDIASMFGVSLSTVYKVKIIYGASGSTQDRKTTILSHKGRYFGCKGPN
jgi:transposase